MRDERIHRVSGIILVVLSLTALITVLIGYTQPLQPDEGALAHIFQLSVLALAPTLLGFLATADWKEPRRTIRALVFPGVALGLAFGALYYLEHYR